MNDTIWKAIECGLTCDITTIGRSSGKASWIEIWYFVVDGSVYITGTPGPRDWYANMLAQPQFVFHVKQGTQADLPAHALTITEPAVRREIMGRIMAGNSYFRGGDLDAWVESSPLVRVEFEDHTA